MNDTFVLGQGQGHELEMALRRNDWTSALLKQATQGDFLTKVRLALEDKAMLLVPPTSSTYRYHDSAAEILADKQVLAHHGRQPRRTGLWVGESWLPTDVKKMTWFEAVEIAAQSSLLRLPDYTDMIELAKANIEHTRVSNGDLQEGEYWTIGSENYKPNQAYACCLTADHLHYESHHLKTELKWVKFILRSPVN
jgi:hypothetical protein